MRVQFQPAWGRLGRLDRFLGKDRGQHMQSTMIRSACGTARGCNGVLGGQRAAHRQAAALEDVGVDHGCLDILVSQEFLNGPDVIAIFQEVGGEGMAEGVAGDAFGYAGGDGGLTDGSLQAALVEIVGVG